MNTKTLLNPSLILGLTLTVSTYAVAMPAPSNLDANGDGQISSTEAQTGLASLFTKIDTNTDNYLSLSEVQAWRESSQVERFNTLDTDKSTSLSLAELQAGAPARATDDNMSAKLFALLDGDKNNALTWEEFSVLEPGKGEIIRHFAMMDSDGDSQISQTEFLTPPSPQAGHGRHRGPGNNTGATTNPTSTSSTTGTTTTSTTPTTSTTTQ